MRSLYDSFRLGFLAKFLNIIPLNHLKTGRRLSMCGLLAVALAGICPSGQAQTAHFSGTAGNFGTLNVGTPSSALTLSFTFDSAGSISVPAVVTQGATGLDFADAGTGTCTSNGTGHSYSAGDTCTVNVIFTPKYPGVRYGAVVLSDSSGNVIATGYVQGTGSGPQVSFPPGTLSQMSLSSASSPWAVAVDSSGNLFVAQAIVAYDPDNALIKETWNGSGYTASTIATGFGFPTGVAVDGAGNIYVADQDNFTVYKETPSSNGTYKQSILDGTLGTVGGIAVDGAGNVYIGRGGIGIEKETLSGGTYTGTEIFYTFYGESIAVDSTGTLYIVDGSDLGIRKETPAGTGYTETILAAGQNVYKVAVDGLSNIYFSSQSQIEKLTPTADGYQQSTISSSNGGLSAVDQWGDVYSSTYDFNARTGQVWKLDSADPPTLSFASTNLGVASADSPQTVTLANIGNAALNFTVPGTGSNPDVPSSFTLNDTAPSACPQVAAGAAAPGTVAAGTSCALAISFVPVTGGTISGSLVLTDNALNATAPSYATQTIALSGTSTGVYPTPTVTVTSSAASAFLSSAVTFTAAVSNSSGTPTGTVTFFDGTTQLGTGTLAAGSATFTTSSLIAGTHSITAKYSGDNNFTAATSSAFSQVIADFTLAVATGSSSSASTAAGGQASYSLTVAPSGATTLAGAITLAVTGGPSGSTATFQPASIAAGSGTTNVTLNLTAPAAAAGVRANRSSRRKSAPLVGALLCLGIVGFRRRLRRVAAALTLLLAFAAFPAILGMTGCGGGGGSSSSSSGSTPQNYTLMVTASAGSLAHTTTLTLTVQ